ncbi:MAG TPA: response regulator transcription factor [Gaiellaceae bacterium]|nr:response regulator transcription factor [Gaiellaceae bacterium]
MTHDNGRLPRANGGPEHPSVLIADDDLTLRHALREALEAHGFDVVGEASDAAAAIGAATRLRPDICLIEIELPLEGLNGIGRIAKASPDTMIVVLTRSDRPEDVVSAFTRGASGYLLKGIAGEQLASTLRGAYRGEPPLARSLVPHLVDEIRRGSIRRLTLPGGAVTLTPREWEVGELLRDGHSTNEIAERLGVSPVTVRRHVGLLLNKLGAENREAAVELLRAYGRA